MLTIASSTRTKNGNALARRQFWSIWRQDGERILGGHGKPGTLRTLARLAEAAGDLSFEWDESGYVGLVQWEGSRPVMTIETVQ